MAITPVMTMAMGKIMGTGMVTTAMITTGMVTGTSMPTPMTSGACCWP